MLFNFKSAFVSTGRDRFELVSIYHRIENVLWQCNVYRQQPERTEIFIFSGLSLSRLVDTKLTSI